MRHLLPLSLLFLFLTACGIDITTGEEVDPTPEAPTGTGDDAAGNGADTYSAETLRVLDLVNETRTAGCTCGSVRMAAAAPLTLHPALVAAAQAHAKDQAAMNRMTHTGSDGSKVGQRATRAGYPWRTVGENVARGYFSAEAAVRGWFESEDHCRNLMNSAFVHLGYGRQDLFYAQVLAAPR